MKYLQAPLALFLSLALLNACGPTDTEFTSPDLPLAQENVEPTVEPTAEVQAEPETENAEETDEVDTPREIIGLDLSSIPRSLQVGSRALELKPQVLYSDESRSAGVSFSVDNPNILKKEGDFVTPQLLGAVKVTFRSIRKPDIAETITIEVVGAGGTVNNSSEGVGAFGVVPGTSSQAEISALKNYFLRSYKVGMRWEYQLQMSALAISTRNDQDLPAKVQLGWGFVIEGTNQGNIEQNIGLYLDQNLDLGRYIIEVVEVGDTAVTLTSEFKSNTPNIKSIASKTQTYTPDSIGDVYTGLIQYADPNKRLLDRVAMNETAYAILGGKTVPYETERFEGVTDYNDGLLESESLSLWMHPEVGMIRSEIHQKGLQLGYLSVDTAMSFKLVDLKGF